VQQVVSSAQCLFEVCVSKMDKMGKIVGLSISSAFGYWAGYNYGVTPVDITVGQTVEERDEAVVTAANINIFKLIVSTASIGYALVGVQNPIARASIVSLGSYILGETFKSYSVLANKERLQTAGGIKHVDWQQQFDKMKVLCEGGDKNSPATKSACDRMEFARSRLPVQSSGQIGQLDCSRKLCPRGEKGFLGGSKTAPTCECRAHTPQASVGSKRNIAVRNAMAACDEGANKACCWLKNSAKIAPPNPCRPSRVSGVSNYMGDF
jgi:hypothetical protein